MLKMEWKHRQGTQEEQPVVLDTTSSPTTVYLRKNIAQKRVTDASGTRTVWDYDEVQLTAEEYKREPVAINQIAELIEGRAANEQAYADILVQQADAATRLDAQDEALADILLNIVGTE